MNAQLLLDATFGALPGYTRLWQLDDQTRKVTVFWSDGDMVVGFHCTKGPIFPPSADWLINGKFWKKSYTYGSEHYRGHAGFGDEYRSFRDALMDWISTKRPEKVTGASYSQGGPHNVQFCRDVRYNFPGVKQRGLACASPRFYDEPSAREFDTSGAHFIRVEDPADWVTHLPFEWMGFRHVGQRVTIPSVALGPLRPAGSHLAEHYRKHIGGLDV